MYAHFLKVANTAVRNAASWAGNLVLAHDNLDFPSDLATVFTGAQATVTVATASGSQTYSMLE